MENNEDKNELLVFPKWEEKIHYLFIFIICSLMRRLIPRIIKCFEEAYSTKEQEDFIIDYYFNLMTNFISDFSVGIVILINKLREHFGNRNTYKIAPTAGIKANLKRYFFFLFSIIALIDFIAQFCSFIYPYFDDENIILGNKQKKIINEEDLYFVVLIDIISRYIFSKMILKGHFYKHHILAIIITIIGFIPLLIINIIDLHRQYSYKDENRIHRNFIVYLILYISMTIIYSLEDVLNKTCLNKLIIVPFELMFYKAVFQIIFVVPLTIYMFLEEHLFAYISETIYKKLFFRIIYRFSFIICNIFRTWSLITIIQLCDPNYLSILKSSEFAIL